jgi:hypothetical protein
MQFGIFTVGDVATDPTTASTPTEAERIRATVQIALKAEEVGLDVFATGEHHNPPFVPSSPTTLLGYIAADFVRLVRSCGTRKQRDVFDDEVSEMAEPTWPMHQPGERIPLPTPQRTARSAGHRRDRCA